MKINDVLSTITDRIIERSKPTRDDYLKRMQDAKSNRRTRSGLSCGNLAHGMAACSSSDKKLIAEEQVANLAIVSAYNDMLSAHQPYIDYPNIIRDI